MHYASAFGAQWKTYQYIQLDSYTGTTYSRDRLERCLRAPLETLRGRSVLEVGSGAGRFTEWLVRHSDRLVCLDASEAVFANRSNCSRLGDYQICRADINASPLRPRSFDVVICLGVIQHTPSPEQTIADLARHVKSGGLLVIDHYARRSSLNALSDRLTLAYPLRAILRRVARRRPDLSLRATKRITAICDPVRKRTQNSPFLHRLTGRVFPTPCYYRAFPRLPSDLVYRWNELDTHDLLSTWFRHRRSREEIIRAMQSAGLASIEAWYGGNGVEAVGRYA